MSTSPPPPSSLQPGFLAPRTPLPSLKGCGPVFNPGMWVSSFTPADDDHPNDNDHPTLDDEEDDHQHLPHVMRGEVNPTTTSRTQPDASTPTTSCGGSDDDDCDDDSQTNSPGLLACLHTGSMGRKTKGGPSRCVTKRSYDKCRGFVFALPSFASSVLISLHPNRQDEPSTVATQSSLWR